MLIPDAISRFGDYLKFEKRYSPHTLTAYLNDLKQFETFAKTTFDCIQVEDVIPTFARSWLASIKDEIDAEPKTINR